jgi:hypothetical protein
MQTPMLEKGSVPFPGMTRTARKQAMRALGFRGTKAKRQFPDRKAHLNVTADEIVAKRQKAAADQAEHERLNRARRAGLIIAPTAAEMDSLKASGKVDHDPRIVLPGE